MGDTSGPVGKEIQGRESHAAPGPVEREGSRCPIDSWQGEVDPCVCVGRGDPGSGGCIVFGLVLGCHTPEELARAEVLWYMGSVWSALHFGGRCRAGGCIVCRMGLGVYDPWGRARLGLGVYYPWGRGGLDWACIKTPGGSRAGSCMVGGLGLGVHLICVWDALGGGSGFQP